MPNLLSNLIECLGFSHTMKSEFFNTSNALKVISSKLPIGVEIMYMPFLKSFIILLCTFIISCAPQNFILVEDKTKKLEENNTEDQKNIEKFKSKKVVDNNFIDYEVSNQVEVLLPK